MCSLFSWADVNGEFIYPLDSRIIVSRVYLLRSQAAWMKWKAKKLTKVTNNCKKSTWSSTTTIVTSLVMWCMQLVFGQYSTAEFTSHTVYSVQIIKFWYCDTSLRYCERSLAKRHRKLKTVNIFGECFNVSISIFRIKMLFASSFTLSWFLFIYLRISCWQVREAIQFQSSSGIRGIEEVKSRKMFFFVCSSFWNSWFLFV